MASQIEEPLSREAHSLPFGSISFGRFETEGLSWERRSAFLHNRYLEEAEKYSQSGAVNERKAYFEVYFRKKALHQQLSSQYSEWAESQTSERDTLGHMSYVEKTDIAGSNHPIRYNESPYSYKENKVVCDQRDGGERSSAGVRVESSITNTKLMQSNYSQNAKPCEEYQSQAEYFSPVIEPQQEVDVEKKHFQHEENEVLCSQRHGEESSSTGIRVESNIAITKPMQHNYFQHAEPCEMYISQTEYTSPIIERKRVVHVEKKHFHEAGNVVGPPEITKLSLQCHKRDFGSHRKALKDKAETTTSNNQPQMLESLGQIRRNSPTEALKRVARPPRTLEKENLPVESQSWPRIFRTISNPKSAKLKDGGSIKLKQSQQRKSKNVKGNSKTDISLQKPVLEKGESRAHQSLNS